LSGGYRLRGEYTVPVISEVSPATGGAITSLPSASVSFSKAVTGVTAGSLVVNGSAATSVTGSGAGPYVFSFSLVNGDINGDNKISMADYLEFSIDFGLTGTDLPSDLNGDGQVDFSDYLIFSGSFGVKGE